MGDKSETLKPSSSGKETAEATGRSQVEIRVPETVVSSEAEIAGKVAEGADFRINASGSSAENTADSEVAIDSGVDQKRLVGDCIDRVKNNFRIFKKQPFLSRKKFIQSKDEYQKLKF